MSTAPAPVFSVVVPVYNEAGNVGPLFNEIRGVLTAIGRPFEVIYVNDGSTDRTLEELQELAACAAYLRIIDLDGNFGEAAALSAGFRAARGPLVITLDGDGQNDPRDIPRLLETLERNGYQAVSGWRQEREEGLLLRILPSRLANRLIAAVSRVPTHDNGCGLKVYRRAVVAHAALPRGMNRFMPAIFGVTAHQVGEVPVNDRRRQHGCSHYGIGRIPSVLRDLLALRFLLTNPRGGERAWAAAAVLALVAHACTYRTQPHWLVPASAALVLVAAMMWWNLRRFNRAQRDGVYRVRCEYLCVDASARQAEGGP
jgi:glycosyltransferase involved in cell wall biosynthesis